MIMVHESRNRRTVNAIFSESWIINFILNYSCILALGPHNAYPGV